MKETTENAAKTALNTAKTALKKKIMIFVVSSISTLAPFFLILFVIFLVIFTVLGIFTSSSSSGIISGTGSCSYNVNGQSVSNIKVRLLDCAGKTPVEGEELIDFETYIIGVVYQETGSASYEALKAQAVAARSFALLRPEKMNNAVGIGLKEENGQWILSLRSCTNDQVFCNPDKGCWSNTKGGQTSDSNPEGWSNATVHSGYDTSKAWTRQPLSEDSEIRKAVEDTAGEVLVNSNNEIIYTNFTNTTQTRWNQLAKQGKDYFEILIDSYGKSGASKLSTPNCETTVSNINNTSIQTLINMSQSEAWKQLIGKSSNENYPSISKSAMDDRVTTITVPYRKWTGTGSDPRKDTTKAEAKITVNAALADLWKAFFTDVYNEAQDFVIVSIGCYNYRNVTGGKRLSAHAYGVACDINDSTSGNGYKDISLTASQWKKLPETKSKYQVIYIGSKIVEIAHRYTLINGSDWNTPSDSMHFSFIADYRREKAQACQGKISCS